MGIQKLGSSSVPQRTSVQQQIQTINCGDQAEAGDDYATERRGFRARSLLICRGNVGLGNQRFRSWTRDDETQAQKDLKRSLLVCREFQGIFQNQMLVAATPERELRVADSFVRRDCSYFVPLMYLEHR
jgi:hypothetical protein